MIFSECDKDEHFTRDLLHDVYTIGAFYEEVARAGKYTAAETEACKQKPKRDDFY
ncbi:hypothetical protein HDV00_003329 [Rhizophlyctis rosea]|nr:hypothetical protein HDV00_003329 [Rhizophlyctis rosea]